MFRGREPCSEPHKMFVKCVFFFFKFVVFFFCCLMFIFVWV
eukprot:UN06452